MVIYDAFSSESGPHSCLGWESVDKESIVSQGFPENLRNYEAYPHQGLSKALRDRNVFRIFSHGSAVGDFPSGASSFITRDLYPSPSIRWLSFRNEPEY